MVNRKTMLQPFQIEMVIIQRCPTLHASIHQTRKSYQFHSLISASWHELTPIHGVLSASSDRKSFEVVMACQSFLIDIPPTHRADYYQPIEWETIIMIRNWRITSFLQSCHEPESSTINDLHHDRIWSQESLYWPNAWEWGRNLMFNYYMRTINEISWKKLASSSSWDCFAQQQLAEYNVAGLLLGIPVVVVCSIWCILSHFSFLCSFGHFLPSHLPDIKYNSLQNDANQMIPQFMGSK